MSDLLQDLQWRYATKKFDPSKTVSQEKVDFILEAIRLSASSSGLQPYEVLVVTNDNIRQKIVPHAWGQEQITDASHLLVFAAWDNYTAERINMMFDLVNEQRGLKNQGWEDYRNMLLNAYPQRDAQTNFEHAARQAYIGLGESSGWRWRGRALIAAADAKVDSTPMEGFTPSEVDDILGLREKGLRSVVMLPLGYRADEGDWLVNLKKVRRSDEDFITQVA